MYIFFYFKIETVEWSFRGCNNLNGKENWGAHPSKRQIPKVWIHYPIFWNKTKNKLKDRKNNLIKIRMLMAGRFPVKYNFEVSTIIEQCNTYFSKQSQAGVPPMVLALILIHTSAFFAIQSKWWIRPGYKFTLLQTGVSFNFSWFLESRSRLWRKVPQMVLQNVYSLY